MAKNKGKKANEAKAEEKKQVVKDDHQKELELVRAELPDGVKPLSIEELDLESTIEEARDLFKKRGHATTQTTQDMVQATKEVIDLVEQGAIWNNSPELRAAFRRVPNSFAKGPVLTTALQLLCGKIAQFDKDEIPVWKIGSKVGNRQVLQDDLGFLRVTGRLPITPAEADAQGIKADSQVPHTYLAHCPHYEGLLFWASEPQHQITSPPAAKRLKKSPSSGGISPISQKETLEKRLEAYRKHLETADRDEIRKAIEGKIESISKVLESLKTEAA